MSKIFKGEGTVLDDIKDTGRELKSFQLVTDYQNAEYVKFGDAYVSLTRLTYPSTDIVTYTTKKGPGQFVGSFLNDFITQITASTIYENVVYENDCLSRGRAINNFNERSNFYTFSLPQYYISGATTIMTGMTTGSTGVYIVDSLSSLTFSTIFTDSNKDTFFVGNNGIKFGLYQRTTPTNIIIGSAGNPNQIIPIINNPVFNNDELLGSRYFTCTDISCCTCQSAYTPSYSSVTYTYDLSQSEGEFIIKGIFKWTNFTYFSNLIGVEYNESLNYGSYPYGFYNSGRDYYFIYLKRAVKPTITSNVVISDSLPLNILTIYPSFNGQTAFPLPQQISTNGSGLLVSVNGITLSLPEFTYSSNTLYITSGYLETSDAITIVYSNQANTPPIQTESYKITSIPNTTYPSSGQKVIYNTSTNKYEYWLDYETVNQPILSVNGQTLSNNIDFYVSSSNKRRLIFVDSLSVGDIITIFYNSITSNGTDIFNKNYDINWTIPEPTTNNLGYFLIQLANEGDTSFTNPIYTGITFYGLNQTIYTTTVSLTGGTYGQKILTKVTNYKNYYTVLGELIQSSNQSDVITFTIKTNALNNY